MKVSTCLYEVKKLQHTKWMNILQSRKAFKNSCKLVAEGLLCELDLTSVEAFKMVSLFILCCNLRPTSNSADLEARSYLRGEAALGTTEYDVKEFLTRWHRLDLEIEVL